MKILYLHQYFNLPEEGGSHRSYYLARAMVQAGHQVEMLTAHNNETFELRKYEGIHIHYLPVPYDQKYGKLKRILSFLKFIRKAQKYIDQNILDVDWVYATSTPLTVGYLAYRLSKKKGIPYFFEVRDLWPLAPIQMGVIRNSLLKKYLYHWEKKIYQKASKIIALSPGIQDYIEKKTPKKEIILIPNMSDCELFNLEDKRKEFLQELGINEGDRIVITYFGALGKANHLDYFLDAAAYFQSKGEQKVAFFIAGKGSEEERLKNKVIEEKINNVFFLPFSNKKGLHKLLNISDGVYVSYAQKPVLETGSPNKFFDALAAGKLCIVNVKGWLKDLVEEYECGFYTDPEQPDSFYLKIKEFLSDPESMNTAKQNARNLAEKVFDQEKLSEKLLSVLESYSLK